jgi:hypothetical protein
MKHSPEKEDFLLYGHHMTEWQRVRPLAQGIAYFDPKTKMAYSHIDYLAEDVRGRLLQKRAFESHSQRAYFIVEKNELNEYKGLTLPYSDEIVPASGQPRGLLLKEHGEREASVLNDIAEKGGNVKAEYFDVGLASLKREGSKIEVGPWTAEDGEIIHYGVLRRWGEDYIPFIRLDLFQIVRQLAIMEGVDHIELLSSALARFGRVLRTAHELGIYHCFTHPGNIDAHGNLIDYEHAIYRDEIQAIKEKLASEDAALFSEDSLRFRDIDLFFGGTRDVISKCQETYKLNREGLMMQIRFLRENISLSAGIPVLESLAHVNIGFYEDTIKKLPIGDQRRIIGLFIDKYRPSSDQVKDRVFSALAREGEWTEAVTGFISDPGNLKSLRQISGEFILGLWDRLPLKQ